MSIRIGSGTALGAVLAASLSLAATLAAATATAAPQGAIPASKPSAAAISSAHWAATEAGHEILAAGGNAFDAAVAVSAALAVVEPSSSGLGGGGFWLLHRASDGLDTLIDGRETAPAGTDPERYLDAAGELDRDKSVNGPLAAGIPGQPAGLALLAERYGKLPLARSLAPAIKLAKDGFPAEERVRIAIASRAEVMKRYPATAAIFLVDGAVPAKMATIKQPDLARTLERFARSGRDGYYAGETASRLVDGVRANGGTWTLADLAKYRAVERKPLTGEYRGYRIVTAPPPSGGGVGLVTMLNVLSAYDFADRSRVERIHLRIEAMRRAFRDRSYILGDPDFVAMPIATLTDPAYAAGLRASIREDRATPSAALPGVEAPPLGTDTTHFSIIDRDGNRVAATMSVNLGFGSAFVPPGTGVILNNEMDDFALKAGAPNAYGLIGSDANAVAPGKRMLSSMTPTFVVGEDRIGVFGSQGGSRINTIVLQNVLDFVDDGATAQMLVDAPRLHHQYLPDVLSAEAGALTAEEADALRALGHTVNIAEGRWGNANAVAWDRKANALTGGADPRGLVNKAIVK